MVKNLSADAGDTGDAGSIPVLGRYSRGGNGNWLHYSCLENSMDRGGWQATVHGITKESDMTLLLSTHTHTIGNYQGGEGSSVNAATKLERVKVLPL